MITALMALVASVVGALIAFLSSLIGARINYNLNEQSKERDRLGAERSRMLELYKVVYPEKVKAAVSLMNKAGAITLEIRRHFVGRQTDAEAQRIQTELDDLLIEATSYQTLLGFDLFNVTNRFRITCIDAYLKPRELRDIKALDGDGRYAYQKDFDALTSLLRKSIQLDEFDPLFPQSIKDT
jgi:hypothetical protein